MATTLTVSYAPNGHIGTAIASWPALADSEAGEPLELPGYSDRSVQVEGTFGSGGSVQLEGSNDGANWQILTDPQGTQLIFTTAGFKQVSEVSRYTRANVTAGDGDTDLAVTIEARR